MLMSVLLQNIGGGTGEGRTGNEPTISSMINLPSREGKKLVGWRTKLIL